MRRSRVFLLAIGLSLLTLPVGATTITSGVDTFVREASPDSSYGTSSRVEWDGSDGGGENHGLLYFPIFQDEGGVINRSAAASAPNLRATLEFDVVNEGSGGDFYANTVGFDDNTTWNSHGGGVRPGVNASSTTSFTTPSLSTGTRSFDVTSQVQSWAGGDTNFGWGMIGQGSNGTEFSSFDSGSGPRLTITEQYDYITAGPTGTTWRYFDGIPAGDPSYPTGGGGIDWFDIGFDDSSWATGSGQFGYGDGDEDTTVASNLLTYVFRTTFLVSELPEEAFLDILRDDAIVVYLNGVEVLRDNMPAGPIDASTPAASVGGENQRDIFQLAVGGFVLGTNTLAIEVHNHSSTSSDISFEASVWGTIDSRLTQVVPEPTTGLLLMLGLAGLSVNRRRR